MSNRWGDASTSLFIFDDQCSDAAAQTQKSYRGKLLHLMSLLHCFACLHLMRREEEEEDTGPTSPAFLSPPVPDGRGSIGRSMRRSDDRPKKYSMESTTCSECRKGNQQHRRLGG